MLLAYEALLVAGGMPASTGSCSTDVCCKHPVIIRKVQLRLTSSGWCACFCSMLGRSIQLVHTQVLGQREVWSVDGLTPHSVPTTLNAHIARYLQNIVTMD